MRNVAVNLHPTHDFASEPQEGHINHLACKTLQTPLRGTSKNSGCAGVHNISQSASHAHAGAGLTQDVVQPNELDSTAEFWFHCTILTLHDSFGVGWSPISFDLAQVDLERKLDEKPVLKFLRPAGSSSEAFQYIDYLPYITATWPSVACYKCGLGCMKSLWVFHLETSNIRRATSVGRWCLISRESSTHARAFEVSRRLLSTASHKARYHSSCVE